MGGDCIGSDLVQISTGNDFVKMVIETAQGIKPEIHEPAGKVAAIRFIFNENDKKILEKFEAEDNGVRCIRKELKPITMREVTDSSTRYGYFIFSCNSRKDAERILAAQ